MNVIERSVQEKIYQYQVKYGEEISISVSDDDFSQSKSKSSMATNGVFEFDSNDDEFIEEEMLILVINPTWTINSYLWHH